MLHVSVPLQFDDSPAGGDGEIIYEIYISGKPVSAWKANRTDHTKTEEGFRIVGAGLQDPGLQ